MEKWCVQVPTGQDASEQQRDHADEHQEHFDEPDPRVDTQTKDDRLCFLGRTLDVARPEMRYRLLRDL